MAESLDPPHSTVEVGFSNSDYVNVCARYGGGDALLNEWRDLGDFLAHRPGWHFEVVNDGEALWSLGAFGESQLNIGVAASKQFHCFDYVEDRSVELGSIGEIDRWLAEREEDRRKPSELLLSLASDSDWRVLKAFPFSVEISWSDGWFIGSVRKLPEDVVFEKELATAVLNVRLLIARYFGAPESVATQLSNVSVRLDTKAVRQLLGE